MKSHGISRSRGGQTTKVHPLADVLRRPVASELQPGNGAEIAARRPAADSLPPPAGKSESGASGIAVACRRRTPRALVAMARKLAVILNRIWRYRADFRVGPDPAAA